MLKKLKKHHGLLLGQATLVITKLTQPYVQRATYLCTQKKKRCLMKGARRRGGSVDRTWQRKHQQPQQQAYCHLKVFIHRRKINH
jgi:hypothetical protein